MGWHVLDMLSAAFPPKPAFTEKQLPDLSGRVYLITGANTGVGKELAQLLYAKNARVHVAARDEAKANAAIAAIRDAHPDSKGALVFLPLDLADLDAVRTAARRFLEAEQRLDVLFNNAGVMLPAAGSRTAQGYELQLGVNNVGPFLLTKLLTPLLASTAKQAPKDTVRVVWVASSAAEMVPMVPTGGVDMASIDARADTSNFGCYALSKAGNYLHGVEYAVRHTAADGVLSVPLNPGNLDSELWRTQGWLASRLLRTFVLHPSIYGAYTELFAGLSPDVTAEKSGQWGEFESFPCSLVLVNVCANG